MDEDLQDERNNVRSTTKLNTLFSTVVDVRYSCP